MTPEKAKELCDLLAEAKAKQLSDWEIRQNRHQFPEDVAHEVTRCIGQVDDEFSTTFKQFNQVGNEIDIQTYSGQWFKVIVTSRPFNPPSK